MAEQKTNQTLVLMKPNVMANGGTEEIVAEIKALEYRVVARSFIHPSKDDLRKFYAEHTEKPWFQELLDYMTEGTIMALRVEGVDAVNRWRKDIDAFREKYGEDFSRNGFHGSDSEEAAVREITLFFGEDHNHNINQYG
jgi:nucleoside-diphosphate kinase